MWTAAVLATTLPLPFVGTWIGLVCSVLSWSVILAAVVVLGVVGGRRWVTGMTTAVTLVLAAGLLNWSAAAPAAWFDSHRGLYERAARDLETADGYYGAELPLRWRPLSANGRVRSDEAGLFFPQWLGIPDDAGGYFYAPDRSPQGADMFGTTCRSPEDLGGGWWSCGM